MPKGYWVITFRAINDAARVEAYRNLAGPALLAEGARFIVRGLPAKTYEKGQMERVVVIEFESLEKAIAAHESQGYQAALQALGDGAERDLRIIEGA
jgi:uncharacterized protein (DUF1330 family)